MSDCDHIIYDIRKNFPFFSQPVNQGWVYFDSAATALKSSVVLDAAYAYDTQYTANIHRAVFDNSYKASDMYEKARVNIAAFVGAEFPEEVIFTSGTTASINFFARSYAESFLVKGSRIVSTEMEHHANIVIWQKIAQEYQCELVYIPITTEGALDLSHLDELLTSNTKLLALSSVSNVLGTINPIDDIAAKCKEKNIHVFVDAAQSIMHISYQLKKNQNIDFLAFSGHKMFAPTGVGVFYGRKSLLKQMPPFLYGGGMVYEVSLEKTTYAQPPSKFEGGTPPISQAIALGAAVDYLNTVGRETLGAIEAQNLRLGFDIFSKYQNKGITLIGDTCQRVPIFSFVVNGVHPHDAGSFLNDQKVSVRTGHQCTQPLMKRYGVGALTRVSSSLYNTSADWQQLDLALEELISFFEVEGKV